MLLSELMILLITCLIATKNSNLKNQPSHKKPQPVLVSLALSEIISATRCKYEKLPVEFNISVEPDSNFAFINIDQSNFKRSIANLINNAAEAFDSKKGSVSLNLSHNNREVKIVIQDNGKGIPPEVLKKINSNINITSGKESGSGIGLTQVRSTLQTSNGKMSIESEVGYGTTITLTFPKTESPDWVAEQITLHKDDTIIVLDDDVCIHDVWNNRFEDCADLINLKHFNSGEETINFINNFPEKHKLFLLADFELIGQELNGLQVIEKVAMQNQSVLVTSHYDNQEVHKLATYVGVKILPKQIALDAPIEIEETERNKNLVSNIRKASLVIIDDDQMLADSTAYLLKDRFEEIEVHYHPNNFLKNLHRYDENTTFCIDHDFKDQIDGFELAKKN